MDINRSVDKIFLHKMENELRQKINLLKFLKYNTMKWPIYKNEVKQSI